MDFFLGFIIGGVAGRPARRERSCGGAAYALGTLICVLVTAACIGVSMLLYALARGAS